MVFNLTETVAVTQNFCDSHNFADVYKDLSKDKEFDKGKDLSLLFRSRLHACCLTESGQSCAY
jgi:hypothetical protein